MMYEIAAMYLKGSTDFKLSKEDTYRNNTLLASSTAFYRLIRGLNLDEMDKVAEQMKEQDNPLYKLSWIKKWNINPQTKQAECLTADIVINNYLKYRQRSRDKRLIRGVSAEEQSLMRLLKVPAYFSETDIYNLLFIIDRYFETPFSDLDLKGYEVEPSLTNLKAGGYVRVDTQGYILTAGIKERLQTVLDKSYELLADNQLEGIPDYDGLLFVDGKAYRPAVIPAGASVRDGGKGGIDFRAAVKSAQIEKIDKDLLLRQLAQGSGITDLAAEWRKIQRDIQGDTMPYSRIKKFYAACSLRTDGRAYQQQVMMLVLSSLRFEEEANIATAAQMKEIVMLMN
jgi:hypothetical protein